MRFFSQAADGIPDLARPRGIGDVYKCQPGSGGVASSSSSAACSSIALGAALGDGEGEPEELVISDEEEVVAAKSAT